MIVSHLVLGFVTSFLGYLPPSMLNIAVSKITIEKNKKEARYFILGVLLIVFFQVFAAIVLSSYITKTPQLLTVIKKVAIFIFALLSVFFCVKAFFNTTSQKRLIVNNKFIFGITLSIINMFAIPFFSLEYTFYTNHGLIANNLLSVFLFALGTVSGVFAVLYTYAYIAYKLEQRLIKITKYFNLIIGVITGVIAMYSAVILYL
ncbi:hypothetical protein ACQY1Q_06530 [Tenacibaculum sp. TC6]|uniref:hypothetical protein n=1 Tax=Tenacibaculum sp. TC6 TaxID=3423223 RepID=UPI003D36C2A3